MKSLLDLPNEILLDVLKYVLLPASPPSRLRDRASVLQVNKFLYALAYPIFHEHLILTVPSLCRLPSLSDDLTPWSPSVGPSKQSHDRLPSDQSSSGRLDHLSNTTAYTALTKHLRTVHLTLHAFPNPLNGRLHTTPIGTQFLCLCSSTDAYLRFEAWRVLLNARLTHLLTLLPACNRLTRLELVCRLADTVCGRVLGGTRPLLAEDSVAAALGAASKCSALEALKVDTADAEESGWSPSEGVGRSCAMHICEAIRGCLENGRQLREVTIRRRDICPRALDLFSASDEHTEQGNHSILPRLEHLTLDLRMLDAQRTSAQTWEAHARNCGCRCWCVSCLHRIAARDNASLVSNCNASVQWEAFYAGSTTLPNEMATAATALAGRLNRRGKGLRTAQVLAFECPEKDMVNRSRKPIVLDCIAQKKVVGSVW